MKIIIESPHFVVSKKLQEYTIEKVGHLTHFDDKLLKSQILLKLENSSKDDNKICEITASGDQKSLFASSRSQTFENAIIQVVHALKQQLGKQKKVARRDGRKMENFNDPNQEETE